MEKAILNSTGIVLDVIGETESRATDQGLLKAYKVKKENAGYLSSFTVTEDKITFIDVNMTL